MHKMCKLVPEEKMHIGYGRQGEGIHTEGVAVIYY